MIDRIRARGADKLWIYASDVYDVWIANDQPKYTSLRNIYKTISGIDIRNTDSMLKFFKKYGNPTTVTKWNEFMKDRKGDLV